MSFYIIVNEDGTIETSSSLKIKRKKGNNLIELPSDYTVIDTETTGLDPVFDEIIEIGAIKVRNNEIVDQYQTLLKPEEFVPEFITELTGITNEMLENAPKIESILPGFIEFIQDDILLGHNIHFDINFLYDYIEDVLNLEFSNDFVDLLRLARKVYPEFENHKLATVGKNLNLDISGSHRSIKDCMITHKSFQLLKAKVNNDIDTLKSLWSSYTNSGWTDLTKIKADVGSFKEDHLFYAKNCVFTGKLEKMARTEAAQCVANIGGICQNGVTMATNFLILGNFDYSSNIKGNKSSKLKKAERYILAGQDLQILSEDVFYDLISGN